MNIPKDQFFLKAMDLGISKEQAEALWSSLEQSNQDSKSYSFSKWMYYFGALIIIAAMVWLIEQSWVDIGGGAKFLIAFVYAILFSVVGMKLWKKEDLKIPGGLCITIAVCMVPLAIYGLVDYLKIWPADTLFAYHNFFNIPVTTEFAMGLGTIFAGLLALKFVPFPFLTAPIFLAAWFLTKDFYHLIIENETFWDGNEWISMIFGCALVIIAYVLDLKKMKDYAFWGYFFGLLAFWISLTSLIMYKGEFFNFIYFTVNLLMMITSILLNRKIFMVFGALGAFIYFNHLAYSIFKDSIVFPFALICIGIAIICLGIFYQKNSKWIEEKILEAVPDWIKKFVTLLALFATYPYPIFSSDSSINHALVSVYAVQCDNGKVLMAENCDLSMTPASCMKIVTTAAALHLLGPNSRFETHLEYDGSIDDMKVLNGNICIRGGGDPCLGSERIAGTPSWKKQMEIWADAIQQLGIHKIKGKIMADTSKWETALAVPSWLWEDLGNYYGAGASALSFHENFYSIFFRPGNKIGQKTGILRTDPPLGSPIIQNEVKTGPEGSGDCACIYGSEFSPIQFIRGTIPLGVDEFSIKGAIPDPATLCVDLLTKELQKRKIIIEENTIEQQTKKISFHITYSPPIKEIVHWTNQKSINLYAEHLLKKMGEVTYAEGSTDSGILAVTNFLDSQNINLNGFKMADGSGLSRKNLITTRQLVEILLKMKKSNFFPIFLESLPQEKDHIRAKSGSMSLIKGYVGYLDNIAFAILINQCPNHQVMQEKINYLLAEIAGLLTNDRAPPDDSVFL